MMEIKSPTPKRKGNHIPKAAPLPIFCDSASILDYSCFGTFSGYFNGFYVIVDDPEEMKALYTMGFFGKASLSKGFPTFGKQKNNEPLVLKDYQWERRKEWSTKLKTFITALQSNKNKVENDNHTASDNLNTAQNCNEEINMDIADDLRSNEESLSEREQLSVGLQLTEETNLSISESHGILESAFDEKEILVISDCNDDGRLLNTNPHIETESLKTVMEVLHLSLEEAFFLSFALGCLQILDLTGKPMSLLQVWQTFNCSQSDFVESYVAYHYFRAKGWVVKSGLKFGGQFLLYKEGPPFYHASYIVLIENIKPADDEGIQNKEGQLTWSKLNSLNRLAETCNKEILICKIQWPIVTDTDKANPLILKKFKVQEFLVRRWQPCQKKETGD